ncbi:MAG: MFS transporter [Chloroflexi bacterium]|nr:MFS transporter [Chloroflexota bacterium]
MSLPRAVGDWRVLLAVYWPTSLVEGLGVSQVFAFLPSCLRGMGVAEADRLQFIGIFSALIFIVGAPFVPLWGVWADKYSRKAVIIRSALVEAVVFAAVALSREPWQLALSLLLIGLQLGNTGVMLAAIRDVVPRARLGTIIAFFGASGPIGFAVGPVLGGIIVDGLGQSLSTVFAFSALLSVLAALLLAVATREIRPKSCRRAPSFASPTALCGACYPTRPRVGSLRSSAWLISRRRCPGRTCRSWWRCSTPMGSGSRAISHSWRGRPPLRGHSSPRWEAGWATGSASGRC